MEQLIFLTYRPSEGLYKDEEIQNMLEWIMIKSERVLYYRGLENSEHVYNGEYNHCHIALKIKSDSFTDLEGWKRAFYREWKKQEYTKVDTRHAFKWEIITNWDDCVGYCLKTYIDLDKKCWIEGMEWQPAEYLEAAIKAAEQKNKKVYKEGINLKPLDWASKALHIIRNSGVELTENPWKWHSGRKEVICINKDFEHLIEQQMWLKGYMCMQQAGAWSALKQKVDIYLAQQNIVLRKVVSCVQTATKQLQEEELELL